MLAGAGGYIANTEMMRHNNDVHAHPQMSQQLDVIQGQLLRDYIMQLDGLLCDDPFNRVYRAELAEAISKYEDVTGNEFPRELLRCARVNN